MKQQPLFSINELAGAIIAVTTPAKYTPKKKGKEAHQKKRGTVIAIDMRRNYPLRGVDTRAIDDFHGETALYECTKEDGSHVVYTAEELIEGKVKGSNISRQRKAKLTVRTKGEGVWGSDLYFVIDSQGHAKIGRSRNAKARILEIQAGSALPLSLSKIWADFGPMETTVHKLLTGKKRHLHREWFTGVTLADVEAIVDSLEIV